MENSKLNSNLIGIMGYARSGKDTVGDMLVSKYNNTLTYDSFEWVKEKALEMGWDGVKDKKGRQLLIDLGKTLRAYDSDFLLRPMDAKFQWCRRQDFNMVVTNIRRREEAEYIVQHGGTLIVVSRPKATANRINDITEAYHEWIHSYPTTSVRNNGTLQELKEKVWQLSL